MMKITGLSHLFKWENLHNWWLTKYFFDPVYIAMGWRKMFAVFNMITDYQWAPPGQLAPWMDPNGTGNLGEREGELSLHRVINIGPTVLLREVRIGTS
jgi:hypothetical protein